MKRVTTLALGFLREHPVRVLLTTIATAAATCLVIWVASSYEALHKTYDEYANLALGRYELAVAPISMDADDHAPADCLHDLRSDPAVAAADPMWAQRIAVSTTGTTPPSTTTTIAADKPEPTQDNSVDRPRFADGPGAGPDALLPDALFLATDAPEPPFDMQDGQWLSTSTPSPPEAVVRADVARRRGWTLNDEIVVERRTSDVHRNAEVRLRVVGIVAAPSLAGAEAAGIPVLAPSSGEIFISTAVAEELLGKETQISLIGISLSPQADLTKFRFGWSPRLSRYSTPVQFQEAYEIEEALDQAAAARNVRLQSYASTGVAMLVSLLVIFCTLSMGVTERIRQYAVLRAVALTRAEVGSLIAIEGLVLGTLGFCCGVALGWILLRATATANSTLLYHGVPLGATSLCLAGVATLGGGLLASIIPAWRATRVRPIDAMAPRPDDADAKSVSLRVFLAGLVLIAVTPLLTFVVPSTEQTLLFAMAIGFVCMALGFILIAPTIVSCVDRWCSPVLARLAGVDPKLLASQMSVHLWRTVGAAISMAFAMGLFVGIHVWGFTMLQAFIPGNWVPDAIVSLEPGLPPEKVARVAALPDVDSDRCLPMVAEQPRLLHDLTGSAERASVTRQDNVVIVGLDPQAALGGTHSLLKLDWVAGNTQTAIEQMQQGRGCVVPDHFLVESGLGVGDSFALVPPEDADRIVEYTIAGAVRLPGWHWQTKLTGLRPRTHRAAALVFAGYDAVARDFALDAATHIWFSFASPEVDAKQVATTVEATVQQIQKDSMPEDLAGSADSNVRVIPVQSIRDHLRGIARRWIWVISQVPLVALLIASLGVVNVLLASVRSRRWELGVLRSVGFTRSQLARAILVEGLLIAVVACLLALGFGILAGWCGCRMAQYFSFFGGLHPPLVIPWTAIALGLTLVMVLGVLSAAWPACLIGRAKPLTLLQEGLGEF